MWVATALDTRRLPAVRWRGMTHRESSAGFACPAARCRERATMLTDATIQQLAQHLHDARLARQEVGRLTEATPQLDLEAAYRVMRAGRALRLAAGEKVVGYKMGLTSKAKREQMNLPSPCYGVLTDKMQVA